MAADDVEFGHVVDLTLGEPSGTELVADAAVGATSLVVDYAGDFEDAGALTLNGAVLPYVGITYGVAETDPDTITLAAPLAAAATTDDKVGRMAGGAPVLDWLLHVSQGDGHPVDIPIPFEQRALWSSVDVSTPVPVFVSADLERLVEVPGREPVLDGATLAPGTVDGSSIDPATLPTPALTDGNPPTTAPTVTFIGGIGSVFCRWTEVANNDPVTYRLHVRAGSAPTTDGTYEVAAGVGLTSASVRKLKDGTAIVGDGSVTYHAIVTVEDADSVPPAGVVASATVTGVPAQVTNADIATGAVTTDTLVFNSGWGVELSGESITGATVTGSTVRTSASGRRVELAPTDDSLQFFSGNASETLPGKVESNFDASRPWVNVESPKFGGAATAVVQVMGSSAAGGDSEVKALADIVTLRATTSLSIKDPFGEVFFFDLSGKELTLFSGAKVKSNTGGFTVDSSANGSVGTGTFRDSVDARADARIVAANGAWATYTPTLTAATTNPNLANFTRAGRYSQVGKTVRFSIVLTCTGTGGTGGVGAGTYVFGLPVAARNADEVVVQARQSGPIHGYIGTAPDATTLQLALTSTDTNMNNSNSGMTTGTILRITGTYEAA